MAIQDEISDVTDSDDGVCHKCGMPLPEIHAVRCPKCAMPLVPDTKVLSSPLGGQPWAIAESDDVSRMENGEPMPASGARVTLTVTAGSQRGRRLYVTMHQVILFGRCPKNDLAVDDEFASWHHLLLEINPPFVGVHDLGSLNGTYVNRVRIGSRFDTDEENDDNGAQGVLLRDGDALAAGMNGIHIAIDTPSGRTAIPGKVPERVDIPGYVVHHPLKQGGVGRAFRATRERNNAPAVVKILNPNAKLAAARREQVLYQLQTLQALRFPHLTRIEDCGIHDGWCWIATKFKTGDAAKLARRRGGRLAWELVLPILLQALKGLAHAHNMGFVHHNLRPSSLLIRKEKGVRFVQLRDLGLTRIVEQFGLQPLVFTGDGPRDLEFTPRERVTRFRKVLQASDVWSMAACAYYLLTGYAPRDISPGDDGICSVLEVDAVPIRKRLPTLPRPLAGIIDAALAPDLSRRYSDAETFRDALKTVARQLGVNSATPESAPSDT